MRQTPSVNGHVELQYQSAFPLTSSKVAMLLFLSTEAMLFAALIGSYIVLRFSGGGVWPDQGDVQVNVLSGLVNTVVLMVSSLTMLAAVRASAADHASKATIWLMATLLLGTGFLVIKGFEYSAKFADGIYPMSTRSLMYDRADDEYLSRTVSEMRSTIGKIEKQIAVNPDQLAQNRLEKLHLLQAGIVDWTQYKVGRSGDSLLKRMAIGTMAHQIHPLGIVPGFEKYIVDEALETKAQQEEFTRQLDEVDQLLKQSQANLKTALPKNDRVSALERERFERASAKTARLTEAISEIRKELVPLESRLQAIHQFAATPGINQQFQLKLPIVIPGGNRWASVYYLLTGVHAVHILFGLVAMAVLLPLRLGIARAAVLENVSLYWLFVDLVWLAIFVIIYLL